MRASTAFFAIMIALLVVAYLGVAYAAPAPRVAPISAPKYIVEPTGTQSGVQVTAKNQFRIRLYVGGNEYEVPVRFQHMAQVQMQVDGNMLRIRTRNREFNCILPDDAARRLGYMLQRQIRARDKNMIQQRIMEQLQLGECTKYDQITGEYIYAPCYTARVRVNARILGIIPVTVDEEYVVDAETGQVSLRGPWWAFLLIGEQELVE